jgi:hypothetical protein
MSSGMHLFIKILLLSLLLSVLGLSLFRIAILRKTSPPFRGKLSLKQSKASMRYMLTFCLLWAGIEVCMLMLHDGHEMRLYNGFMALIFLAMAWLAPSLDYSRNL